MKAVATLPDDLYGFGIEELKNILKRVKSISGAKITNKEWDYSPIRPHQKLKIKRIRSGYILVASSKKRLDIALGEIQKAIRDRDGFKKFEFKR